MTAPADEDTLLTLEQVEAQWRTRLTPKIAAQVTSTGQIKADLYRAYLAGWTIPELVTASTYGLSSSVNPGGTIASRLKGIADGKIGRGALGTNTGTAFATFVQPLDPCGNCDPQTRWTNDTPARRCSCWTDPRTATP